MIRTPLRTTPNTPSSSLRSALPDAWTSRGGVRAGSGAGSSFGAGSSSGAGASFGAPSDCQRGGMGGTLASGNASRRQTTNHNTVIAYPTFKQIDQTDLHSIQAENPRVAHSIVKRLLIQIFCVTNLPSLFECHEVLW